MSETGWNIGTGRYIQRPNPRLAKPAEQGALGGKQRENLGFTWDSSAVPWSVMSAMETPRALARFQKQLAGHVWDAAALEGNPYTLPEVQTLLEGVTVGGHRLDDEKQVLALAESTRLLHDLVQDGSFVPNRHVSDRIHGLVAPHEAIEAGHFRGEGSVRGGGTVNLGEYGTFQATGCDDDGEALRAEYNSGLDYLASIKEPAERAVAYFCFGTRHQFYFDGNKRTSRLMMNGILLSSGLDAISIPFARRLEFNQHLITLFLDANATPLMGFIIDCRPAD